MEIIFILMLFLLPGNSFSSDDGFKPWDSSLYEPAAIQVKTTGGIINEKNYLTSTPSIILSSGVRFFQIFISPQDGPNCRYNPVCSRYAYISISRYGFFWGFVMASDRLLRCNPFGLYGDDFPQDNCPFRDQE